MKLWNLKQMVKVKVPMLMTNSSSQKHEVKNSCFQLLFHFINQVHHLQVLTEHLTKNFNPLHFIDKQDMPDEGDFLSYQTVNKCATSKQRKFLSLRHWTELPIKCSILNAGTWHPFAIWKNPSDQYTCAWVKNKY